MDAREEPDWFGLEFARGRKLQFRKAGRCKPLRWPPTAAEIAKLAERGVAQLPFGAAGAAILFGYTQGLQNALLLAGITTVPRQFVSMIPYVVTIIAVSGFVGRVRPPAAEGKVYETEGGSE